jgi:hypothetical protein
MVSIGLVQYLLHLETSQALTDTSSDEAISMRDSLTVVEENYTFDPMILCLVFNRSSRYRLEQPASQ